MSFIFGGLHVGSLLGLFVAPPLIERFGWPTVFYAFGLLGQSLHGWTSPQCLYASLPVSVVCCPLCPALFVMCQSHQHML